MTALLAVLERLMVMVAEIENDETHLHIQCGSNLRHAVATDLAHEFTERKALECLATLYGNDKPPALHPPHALLVRAIRSEYARLAQRERTKLAAENKRKESERKSKKRATVDKVSSAITYIAWSCSI